MAILKAYFGYLPGQGLKEFAAEVRMLTAEEKEWLVVEAARMLGVEIDRS